jgi:mRNA-degrading endonuclease RelE of RelBE toxin-antitoxin system
MRPEHDFEIIYAPIVREHLRSIERKHYSLIREAIETQLSFEPEVETKNRKPLKRPDLLRGAWEIHFGPGNRFRVFYEVDRESRRVYILAIGEKRGNRLWVAGEEVE